eukprot:TRINITY_DN13954_c0_g1_i1.p1 TRINITY_DN13954_c0_g1~~TRINITY_DN13954_c0_g1_i1.p1  ORF type:complete len:153 (+),score=50.57 TRINITY_DN13954_c0_g1_i1:125-583(+)
MPMSFADELTEIMASAKRAQGQRTKESNRWARFEDSLLEEAMEMFKNRCMSEAEHQKKDATVSFEVLTRDIKDFPTRVLKDNQYIVDDWQDAAASWWYYSYKGTTRAFDKNSQVPFAELLESMMPKFVEKCRSLGFQRCDREAGSWKVKASW